MYDRSLQKMMSTLLHGVLMCSTQDQLLNYSFGMNLLHTPRISFEVRSVGVTVLVGLSICESVALLSAYFSITNWSISMKPH